MIYKALHEKLFLYYFSYLLCILSVVIKQQGNKKYGRVRVVYSFLKTILRDAHVM